MTRFELSLNETELLLVPQVMKGKSSKVGYLFDMPGLEKADFTNEGSGDMFKNEVVKEADEYGLINKVHLNIDHPQFPDDQDVTLRIHADGRITSTKRVEEELLNSIHDEIVKVKSYQEFTTPLNQLIDRLLDVTTNRGTTRTAKINMASGIFDAFEDIIDHHYPGDELTGAEKRTYESIIANVGIYMIDNQVPNPDSSVTVPGTYDISNYDGDLQKFFEKFGYEILGKDNVKYAWLSKYVEYLLAKDWGSPLEIADEIEGIYE